MGEAPSFWRTRLDHNGPGVGAEGWGYSGSFGEILTHGLTKQPQARKEGWEEGGAGFAAEESAKAKD